MQRRQFLAGTGLLTGAAAAGGFASVVRGAGVPAAAPHQAAAQSAPQPSAPAKRTLRKAVMIGMVEPGETVGDKIKIARDCGFEGLELDSPNPWDPEQIIKARDESGIVIHGLVNSVHWRHPLNAPDATTRLECIRAVIQNIEDCKRYGATSILLVPAVVGAFMSYQDAYDLSQREIRELLPKAEAAGVKISIENVWNGFLLSPLEAARYVDELNSPAAAFHFDIGNVINFGWPTHWIRALGPRIERIHIKDFSRKKRDAEGLWKGFDVELGDGDADWPRVMRALDEIGYSTAPEGRWATAEVRGGDEARLRDIAARMDRLFAME